jgi:hypothetical protein
MCALCRILHDPIWFGYLLLVENIHPFWVAALVPESMYAWLWRLDLIEILSRFLYKTDFSQMYVWGFGGRKTDGEWWWMVDSDWQNLPSELGRIDKCQVLFRCKMIHPTPWHFFFSNSFAEKVIKCRRLRTRQSVRTEFFSCQNLICTFG